MDKLSTEKLDLGHVIKITLAAALGGFANVEMYDQKDASGFIRCFGLPLKTRALLLGKKTNVDFGKTNVKKK